MEENYDPYDQHPQSQPPFESYEPDWYPEIPGEPIPLEELPPQKEGGGLMRFLIDLLETVLLAVILFLVINAISARIRVDGYSMEPTLHTGEFIIVNKLAYQFSSHSRGDIVVFHYPRNPSDEYIKRIIGLPGDSIQVRDGTIWINDYEMQEPYINADPSYSGSWTVPADSIFVLGDNRNNSSDSHDWGYLPVDYVIGKAVFVYWPPTEWGLIEESGTALAAP